LPGREVFEEAAHDGFVFFAAHQLSPPIRR
jgi:hypothetical protein